MIARTWIAAARARRRLTRGHSPTVEREQLVRRYVPGRSFVDVGCMWSVDGRIAFVAEEAGATSVTGVDLMAPTPAYCAEHDRRDSRVRFVSGDLHDPDVTARVGVHDVVWCSGVVYHAPHPLLTLERLREMTGEVLLLASETIPEVPGLPQACIFYPGLGESHRRALATGRSGCHVGLTTPFDPERSYANWFWGLSGSALRAMLGCAGFEVVERFSRPLHETLVARPRPSLVT